MLLGHHYRRPVYTVTRYYYYSSLRKLASPVAPEALTGRSGAPNFQRPSLFLPGEYYYLATRITKQRQIATGRSLSRLLRMRIATLQFAPQLGDVEANIKRADQLLKLTPGDVSEGPGIEELRPDILVLPEMAFSGRESSS